MDLVYRWNSLSLLLGSSHTVTGGVVIHSTNQHVYRAEGLRGGTIRCGRSPKWRASGVGVEGHSWSLGRPSAESFHLGECPHGDKHQAGQEMGPGQALPLLPASAYSCPPRPASGRAVDRRCQLALGLTLSRLPGFRPPGRALGGSWPHLVPAPPHHVPPAAHACQARLSSVPTHCCEELPCVHPDPSLLSRPQPLQLEANILCPPPCFPPYNGPLPTYQLPLPSPAPGVPTLLPLPCICLGWVPPLGSPHFCPSRPPLNPSSPSRGHPLAPPTPTSSPS